MESRRPIVRFYDSLFYSPKPGGSYYQLVPNELFEEGEKLYPYEVDDRLGIKRTVYMPPVEHSTGLAEVEHSDGLAEVVEDDVISPDDLLDPDTGDLNDLLDSFK